MLYLFTFIWQLSAQVKKIPQWERFEIVLQGTAKGNPFADAVCTVRDVLEKVVTDYPVFPAKPNMEEVKRAFTVLENHSVIQRLEGKFNQGSCRIAILPTILSAVSSEKLNLVVSVLKKEETDEEAEEDPADQLALF